MNGVTREECRFRHEPTLSPSFGSTVRAARTHLYPQGAGQARKEGRHEGRLRLPVGSFGRLPPPPPAKKKSGAPLIAILADEPVPRDLGALRRQRL
jgi:hypothetical protein